ncbi:MAG: hypothetical protein ACRDYA_22890 [Egibacteraceae bacterium]
MADPIGDDGFVRRTKALARTAPVHELEANKHAREGDWSTYDLRALALAAIDEVIDHMGLEYGASGEQVRRRLAGLARAAAPDRPPGEAEAVAAAVLEALLNDRGRREAFAIAYGDWSGQAYRRPELVFKLLEEVEAPDGAIVLRATDEAVNLFVAALDRDVEDAQAAAEAVLASQLRRGRIDQAVLTAREARLRSIQFTTKVRRVLDLTRRDVRQVDWGGDVPRLLQDALGHLDDRLDVERQLLATLRVTLADAELDDAAAAAELVRLVEDCQTRHLELHAELIGARSTFLDEQERQRFAPVGEVRLVDLDEDLLKPLLATPVAGAEVPAAAFLVAASGPRPPRLARICDLVGALLQARRASGEGGEADVSPDLVGWDLDPWRYSPEVRGTVEALLASVTAPTRLSALLGAARPAGEAAAELLGLSVLHAFDPEGHGLQALTDGVALVDEALGGDDLVLHPAAQA